MIRISITWLLPLAAVAVILMGPVRTGLAHSVHAAPSGDINRCFNVQLMVRPWKSLGAATGHEGRWYRIHDTWSRPCSLQGFPGLVLLDHNFHSLPTYLTRGHGYIISGTPPVHRVILDQHHDAYFALEYTDVQIANKPCPAAPYLMVTPPNDKLPVVTYSGRIAPCAGETDVSPVQSSPALR